MSAVRREQMPVNHITPESVANAILQARGPNLVLALPLGLGKANHIANALYARAVADPAISLRILTGLTPEKPPAGRDLGGRFIGPVIERLFGAWPELAYTEARHSGRLPKNIEVNEFFMLAGRWLTAAGAQQSYVSSNYTMAARDVMARGLNVVAQLVARRVTASGPRYSLSGNTDLTLDMLAARRAGRADFMLVGQVNDALPWMGGEAEIAEDEFAHMLDGAEVQFPLFAPPKMPVSLAEYATGIHIARLVPDGGTLQIGIGSIGDAVTQALILRHRDNAAWREIAARLAVGPQAAAPMHDEPFTIGLYGLSEMLVDGFLALMRAGILKREVDGVVLHAAFFLGSNDFYRSLRELSEPERARIGMTAVSFVNQLYGEQERKSRARRGARFINSGMMATLLGAIVSDALDDGRVVSGVGGQYNFVAQAHALEDARSVIAVPAVRGDGRSAASNIRWSYGHTTIPRHLRDIVATAYGIADLRGRSDAECVAAMLAIADSRFQGELLRQAREAGKIARNYEIPAAFRDNTPERIERALRPARQSGVLPAFPLGCDFTETEQRLMPVLQLMGGAARAPWRLAGPLIRGFAAGRPAADVEACLARLDLSPARGWRDRLQRAVLCGLLAVRD